MEGRAVATSSADVEQLIFELSASLIPSQRTAFETAARAALDRGEAGPTRGPAMGVAIRDGRCCSSVSSQGDNHDNPHRLYGREGATTTGDEGTPPTLVIRDRENLENRSRATSVATFCRTRSWPWLPSGLRPHCVQIKPKCEPGHRQPRMTCLRCTHSR